MNIITRIVQKTKDNFMEVDKKELVKGVFPLAPPLNLTSDIIDDEQQLAQFAVGHCMGYGVPVYFLMNTDALISEGKEYYPVQFYGQ